MNRHKDVLKQAVPMVFSGILAAQIALGSTITGPPATAPPPPPPVGEEDPIDPGFVSGGGALGEVGLVLKGPELIAAPPPEDPVFIGGPISTGTPEPATFPLMFVGLAALGWRRFRQQPPTRESGRQRVTVVDSE